MHGKCLSTSSFLVTFYYPQTCRSWSNFTKNNSRNSDFDFFFLRIEHFNNTRMNISINSKRMWVTCNFIRDDNYVMFIFSNSGKNLIQTGSSSKTQSTRYLWRSDASSKRQNTKANKFILYFFPLQCFYTKFNGNSNGTISCGIPWNSSALGSNTDEHYILNMQPAISNHNLSLCISSNFSFWLDSGRIDHSEYFHPYDSSLATYQHVFV